MGLAHSQPDTGRQFWGERQTIFISFISGSLSSIDSLLLSGNESAKVTHITWRGLRDTLQTLDKFTVCDQREGAGGGQ